MTGVLIGFGIITLVILIGYIVGRSGVAGPGAERALGRVAFFVANPALLFTVLAKADLHIIFSSFLLVAFITALTIAAVYVLAVALRYRRLGRETVIGAMAASYVNANNIGIPVAVYVLGSATFVAPVLLIQLLVFAPVILTILDITSSTRTSVLSIVTQPVRNPMIIASVLGVALNLSGWKLPSFVEEPFVLIGGAAVPLILMSFGMSLHGSRPLRSGGDRCPILLATVLKSVVMPVVAYLIATWGFHLHGEHLFAVVAFAALPSAQNAYNFASRYEVGETIARDAVLLTTALAIPAVILIAFLLAN